MAFETGKQLVFKIDNSGGTLTDISSYVTSCSLDQPVDTHETTTAGKTFKTRVVGLKDYSFSVEGNFDPTAHTTLSGIIGLSGSFEYGPVGSSTGDPKATGECIVQNYAVNAPVGELVTWTLTCEANDTLTWGTY